MSSQTDAGEIPSAFNGRGLAESAVTEVAHIELRPRSIGARIKRVEDRRLLTGQGMFTDDRAVAGALPVAFQCSIHAHAIISHIDVGSAAEMPGVVGIYTADDLEGVWSSRCARPPV